MGSIRITKEDAERMAFDVVHCFPASGDKVMYCSGCGKVHMLVPSGEHVSVSGKGVCDCGWNCCEAARPVGAKHAAHLTYRDATDAETNTMLVYCRNCMGMAHGQRNCRYCMGKNQYSLGVHRQWEKDGRPRYLFGVPARNKPGFNQALREARRIMHDLDMWPEYEWFPMTGGWNLLIKDDEATLYLKNDPDPRVWVSDIWFVVDPE